MKYDPAFADQCLRTCYRHMMGAARSTLIRESIPTGGNVLHGPGIGGRGRDSRIRSCDNLAQSSRQCVDWMDRLLLVLNICR